jgi:hypothetical protein
MSQVSGSALEPVPQARVEVLPAEPHHSRIWPAVGSMLIWAARELLPELLAIWQASRSKVILPARETAPLPQVASQPSRIGHRHRRGRA